MPSDVEIEQEIIHRFETALRAFRSEVRACIEHSMYRNEELNDLLCALLDWVPDSSEWERAAKNGGKE